MLSCGARVYGAPRIGVDLGQCPHKQSTLARASANRNSSAVCLAHPNDPHGRKYGKAASFPFAQNGRSIKSQRKLRRTVVNSVTESSSQDSIDSGDSEKPVDQSDKTRIKKTVDNLEAILGIEPEAEEEEEAEPEKPDNKTDDDAESETEVTLDGLLKMLTDFEDLSEEDMSKLIKDKEISSDDTTELQTLQKLKKIQASFNRLADGDVDEEDELLMRKLIDAVKVISIPKEDIELMKKSLFGFSTFWVTEDGPVGDLAFQSPPKWYGGHVFRGNLRGDRDEVYNTLTKSMQTLFGDKYELLMQPDVDPDSYYSLEAEPSAEEQRRVTFFVIPKEAFEPEPFTGFQYGVALLCLGLTVGSCVQLGIVAEVSILPPEIVKWFSNPDNLAPDVMLPPTITEDQLDDSVFQLLQAAVPIYGGVLGSTAAHELGHIIAGLVNGVKTSIPYFCPNVQLGTFGGVTRFRSLIKSRKTLFDMAAAGPAAGGAIGLVMFIAGLAMSNPAAAGDTQLVPLPPGLLQGSLLLGSIVSGVTGHDINSTADVFVHPLLVAGWCALSATALQLLPVGSLDGGRMTQAAFGRSTLQFSGLITYLGLALGLLGGSLSLPFGLFILFTARSSEDSPRDDVTPVDNTRYSIATGAIIFSILTLLPMITDTGSAPPPGMM